ncbi:pyruvate dehydrogenase protein X component, mitochondrial-like [Ornithodoros turicata]|uniref:pyruvate dehydrogenase protein X component, mitochondrial-like n=1 Tax=Ornithodoros turicata TaxID=34597 RepID=UPI0031393FE3
MASLANGGPSRVFKTFRFFPALRLPFQSCPHFQQLHRTALLSGIKGNELRMPALSPTMTEGTIIRWLKKEGDEIQPGDALCEIQTDKAVVAFETEETGILAKILKTENSGTLPINTLIGLTVDEGADWKDVDVPADTSAPPASAESASTPAPAKPASMPAPQVAAQAEHARTDMMGPAVKNLLHMYGLSVDDIPATGPHHVLLKGDVMKYVQEKNIPKVSAPIQKPSVAPPPPPPSKPMDRSGAYEDIPLTNMRRAIAKRLSLSKSTIPHSYMAVECNINETMATRKKFAADGVKVSLNDFIIKAAAVALRRVPDMNAALKNESPVRLPNVDVSVAVATDSGLITPIVKNADSLGIQDISKTIKELATRAKAGKLKPAEFEGGSFAVSNLGMFGISAFTAVINPPQASIMAVGGSRLVPDVSGGGPKSIMTATVSYDPRVCTEEVVATFLAAFREHLENPLHMLGLSAPHLGKDDVPV